MLSTEFREKRNENTIKYVLTDKTRLCQCLEILNLSNQWKWQKIPFIQNIALHTNRNYFQKKNIGYETMRLYSHIHQMMIIFSFQALLIDTWYHKSLISFRFELILYKISINILNNDRINMSSFRNFIALYQFQQYKKFTRS